MEHTLLLACNALMSGPLGGFIAWAGTRAATLAFALAAAGWIALRPGLRAYGLAAALAVGLSELSVSHGLKPIFERPRPCAEDPALLTAPPGAARRCGGDAAFPSGHASATAALAAATASPPLVVVSAMVGAQRVATAQHRPGDVAAGWLWGGALGALLRWLVQRRLARQSASAV